MTAVAQKRIFAAFTKVDQQDDGTLIVSGIASSEDRDSDGELVRAEAMRKALPDYLKFGAVREMHQPIAAGTAIEANVDDKGVTQFTAHVVDAGSVKKVQTGVLKGFSIGGRVTKRNDDDKTIIEGMALTEISLVDRPANPTAVITMVKFDGKGAVVEPAAKAAKVSLKKSLYHVSDLCGCIQSLGWLQSSVMGEEKWEGDGSGMSAKILEHIKGLTDCLKEMVDEETGELIGILSATDIAMAAKAVVTKGYGSPLNESAVRSIFADELKKAHTSGGTVADKNESTTAPSSDEIQKALKPVQDELKKAQDDLAKAQTDLKAANDSLATVTKERDELAVESQKLVDQVMAKGQLRVVEKSDDGVKKTDEVKKDEKPTDALAEIRKSHQNPIGAK